MTLAQLNARQWEEVGRHFDRLTEQSPSERCLDELNVEPVVVDVLRAMLEAHDSDDPDFIDRTIGVLAAASILPTSTDEPDVQGRRFGPWRVLEEVGRGGMAMVLRGERADGSFEKEVAIKLLPIGDDRPGSESLMQEIRILARLEHPRIARLIDGGLDEKGIPYLVMEFVRGQSIDSYCRTGNLSLEQRLSLFDQVLEAVEYAHRHLIVHCDLKPSNILVDENRQVRLIDFGIADLLGKSAPRPATSQGWFCSPAYAAPEQLAGAPPSIGQDVFSLGVVLHELLTDRKLRDNRQATRLWLKSTNAFHAPAAPSDINSGIDRDLDAICLKALSAEPSDRYADAGQLRLDLERRRLRRPVEARGGGRLYHLGRFVSRHRWGISAAMVILAVALGGVLATLQQASEARLQAEQVHVHAEQAIAEARRAHATRGFLIELFTANDPDVAQGNMPTARDLLDLGAHQIHTTLVDAPELQAELLVLLGQLYLGIGELDAAEPLLSDGLGLAETQGKIESIASAMTSLGQLALARDQTETAATWLQQAVSLLESDGQAPGQAHAAALDGLIAALTIDGQGQRALEDSERALEMARRKLDGSPDVLFDYLLLRIRAQLDTNMVIGAKALLDEALALGLPENLPPSRQLQLHTTLMHMLGRIGGSQASGKAHARAALELAERIYPPDHPRRAQAVTMLAWPTLMGGQFDEAETLLRQSLKIFALSYPDGQHRDVLVSRNSLGYLLMLTERYAEAEQELKQVWQLRTRLLHDNHPERITSKSNLGKLYRRMGRWSEAEELLELALHQRQALLGPTHPLLSHDHRVLAELRLDQNRPAEALVLTETALNVLRQDDSPAAGEPRFLIPILTAQARALAALGQSSTADAAYREALSLAEHAPPSLQSNVPHLLKSYSDFLFEQNNNEAAQWLRASLESHHQFFGESHPASRRIAAQLNDIAAH